MVRTNVLFLTLQRKNKKFVLALLSRLRLQVIQLLNCLIKMKKALPL